MIDVFWDTLTHMCSFWNKEANLNPNFRDKILPPFKLDTTADGWAGGKSQWGRLRKELGSEGGVLFESYIYKSPIHTEHIYTMIICMISEQMENC